MNENGANPSTGGLIGEALDDWIHHQGRFWIIAGPAILVFQALPYIEALISSQFIFRFGWDLVPPFARAGIRVLLITLVLYQWFKHALYDDWSQRRHQLWKRNQLPWHSFVSGGFVAFWLLQLLLAHTVNSFWGELIRSQMSSTEGIVNGPFPWFAHLPMPWINEIVLALLFGSFLLFLPARAAGVRLGPWCAFREAAGIRIQLISTALFAALLVIVGEIALNVIETFVLPPRGQWLGMGAILPFVSMRGLLISFVELLALYILAQTVSQLFIMKTGWAPEPAEQLSDAISAVHH